MAQADVLTLVSDLSLGQASATEAAVYYAEIIRELGFREVLTGTEQIAVTAGQPFYSLATSTILALEFQNKSGFLAKSDSKGLAALFGSGWRNKTGSPLAIERTFEDEDTFRVVPAPNHEDTITVIRTETRTDVPVWLELPIAFDILSREFMRESDHQDVEFSGTCVMIAKLLYNLVGVMEDASQKERNPSV